MSRVEEFARLIESEFPNDRLTWQKGIATFHPETAREAADLIKLARNFKQPLYITGFGNNIDPIGQPFTDYVSVRTDRLNDLIKVAPEDFYVTVGSGFPLREINLDIKTSNLFFPHSDLPYVGSVGGAIAANVSATLNDHPLPIRKYLLRAEIVTPEGEIVTPGSACFKSVSGYDIVKLFAPSWGLLGLLVSATFRVMPDTAAEEFSGMRMQAIDRDKFLSVFDENNTETDAVYARKIKAKFDPDGILPIV